MLRTATLIGTTTLATAVAARMGVRAVAAHQVAAQLWLFLALVVDALAIAAQALVSRYVGENDPDTARTVADRLLIWGLVFGCVLGAGFTLLQPVLPGLFTNDAATAAVVLSVFPFVAFLQPLNGLVFVWDGIYMALEDFRYLAKAMIASAIGAAALMLMALAFEWGLAGVWWGMTALMVLRALTLAVPYVRGRLFRAVAETP